MFSWEQWIKDNIGFLILIGILFTMLYFIFVVDILNPELQTLEERQNTEKISKL